MAAPSTTEFGTRIVFRLKSKKYRLDTRDFIGQGHGQQSADFCKANLQDSIEANKKAFTGAANFFVMRPIRFVNGQEVAWNEFGRIINK